MSDKITLREIKDAERLAETYDGYSPSHRTAPPDYPGANWPAWVGDVAIIASYLVWGAFCIAIWEWWT